MQFWAFLLKILPKVDFPQIMHYYRELFRLFSLILWSKIISVFYARRTGFSSSSQCAVMHYILTHFIAKSNAFLHFYRKNQCVWFCEAKSKVWFLHLLVHAILSFFTQYFIKSRFPPQIVPYYRVIFQIFAEKYQISLKNKLLWA